MTAAVSYESVLWQQPHCVLHTGLNETGKFPVTSKWGASVSPYAKAGARHASTTSWFSAAQQDAPDCPQLVYAGRLKPPLTSAGGETNEFLRLADASGTMGEPSCIDLR